MYCMALKNASGFDSFSGSRNLNRIYADEPSTMVNTKTISFVRFEGEKYIINKLIITPTAVLMNRNGIDNRIRAIRKSIPADFI
jgi:hypothetical protein